MEYPSHWNRHLLVGFAALMWTTGLSGSRSEATAAIEFRLPLPLNEAAAEKACRDAFEQKVTDKLQEESLHNMVCLAAIDGSRRRRLSDRYVRNCVGTARARVSNGGPQAPVTMDLAVLEVLFMEAYSPHVRARCLDVELARFHLARARQSGQSTAPSSSGDRRGPTILHVYDGVSRR